MNTIEHLNKIKAKCEQLLAIAEKRTPGEWVKCEHSWQETSILTESRKGERHTALLSIPDDEEQQEILESLMDANATFIVSCAGPAEAGWRSTIAAIDELSATTSQTKDSFV